MKTKRTKIFTGTPWEPMAGYARAVQAGDSVYISGTTGTDPSGKDAESRRCGGADGASDPQHRKRAEAAGSWSRSRGANPYLSHEMDKWEEVAKVHGQFFGEIHPATALVGVTRLVDPEMIVEIEAEAVL